MSDAMQTPPPPTEVPEVPAAPEAPVAPPPPEMPQGSGTEEKQEPIDLTAELVKRTKHKQFKEVETEAVELTEEEKAKLKTSSIKTVKCVRCESDVPEEHLKSHQDDHSTEILPYLYLGGEKNARNLKELTHRTRITHILNMCWETGTHFPEHFEYKHMPLDDKADQNITQFFENAIEFIARVREANGRVLVHCVQGRSRSATVVLAYLIKSYRMRLDDALQHVVTRRPFVRPNDGFIGQLRLFESMTFMSSVTIDGKSPSPPVSPAHIEVMDSPDASASPPKSAANASNVSAPQDPSTLNKKDATDAPPKQA